MTSVFGSDNFYVGDKSLKDCNLCTNNSFTIFKWCLENAPAIAKIMRNMGYEQLYDSRYSNLTLFLPREFKQDIDLLYHTIGRRVISSEFEDNGILFQTLKKGYNIFYFNNTLIDYDTGIGSAVIDLNFEKTSNGNIYIISCEI